MIVFDHKYNAGSMQHEFSVSDGDQRLLSTSISLYKLRHRTTEEVVKCTLNMVSKLLNELNQSGETDNESTED